MDLGNLHLSVRSPLLKDLSIMCAALITRTRHPCMKTDEISKLIPLRCERLVLNKISEDLGQSGTLFVLQTLIVLASSISMKLVKAALPLLCQLRFVKRCAERLPPS